MIKPICPLQYPHHCDGDECAWWCSFANKCAIAVIPEINESYMLKCMFEEIDRRFGKQVD